VEHGGGGRASAASLVSSDAQHPPSLLILPFHQARCLFLGEFSRAGCHIPALPLDRQSWLYTEPGPYNPPGNLQAGQVQPVAMDLTSDELPQPRLKSENGVVWVPLFTDFKLHNICKDKSDPNVEPLNANDKAGSEAFFAGNGQFLTRRLWAVGSKPNFFHHGQYTTMREAILNHFGEAIQSEQAFSALSPYGQ
jgi:hypothetical protein